MGICVRFGRTGERVRAFLRAAQRAGLGVREPARVVLVLRKRVQKGTKARRLLADPAEQRRRRRRCSELAVEVV